MRAVLRGAAKTENNQTGEVPPEPRFHGSDGENGRRKECEFVAAEAFFLLAEPLMLQTALEVIIGQIEDLDLAFVIARLVEGGESEKIGSVGMLGGGGGMMGMGGFRGMCGFSSTFNSAPEEEKALDDEHKVTKSTS